MMDTHQENSLLNLIEDSLLPQKENNKIYTGDGSVDIKGHPVLKGKTGIWKACPFILSTECCERLANYGIGTNLVSYLTKHMHFGNASAATTITTWQGTCFLTPLLGAVLADAYLGRYWTISTFLIIYLIGMCTLTLSASAPALRPGECEGSGSVCPSATPLQKTVFFSGLYLIAIGSGGIKPCVSSFGADQFDDTDPDERAKKGSFFNWYYLSINIGALVATTLIVWAQDNLGWGIGFGVPSLFIAIAIAIFFSGTNLYRFCPVTRHCSAVKVEDLKSLVRILPICATGLVFSVVLFQVPTMSVEQGMVMDNAVGAFEVPPASLETFLIISVLLWIPIYDRIIIPFARKITGVERGFSVLYRIGIGLFLSILCVLAAASVEIERLKLARELDLVDGAIVVPMSILWQIPQYILLGAAEVFTFVGQLEFFYDQSPIAMRSLSTSILLLTYSLGNYMGSFILTLVTFITTRGGKTGWVPNNLNEGHLNYYFLLLTGLSSLNMVVYIFCAKSYKSKQTS